MKPGTLLARFTIDRLACALTLTGAGTIACLMPAQNDTWWHLRAGYEMLGSGSVLLTDTFSHTIAGQPWPNYEWLTEVVFALVHRAGGMPLLTAVCASAILAGLTCLYLTMTGDTIRRTLLLAGVVAGSTLTWSVRPQAFSLGLLGLTLLLVRRGHWWVLPPVFLLWANLHGAVALGGLVLLGACAAFLLTARRPASSVIASSVACAAATIATPLNVHYWPEIARSIARSRVNDIAEWRPPALPPEHLVFWGFAIALVWLSIVRQKRLHEPTTLTFAIGAWLALLLASRSMRNISPFLMIAASAIDALLGPATVRDTLRPQARWQGLLHASMLACALFIAALVVIRAWTHPNVRMGWHPLGPEGAAAIDSCRGPLYNRYADGGPIIFFAPHQPVLLDSRQDPYPVSLVEAQFEVERTGTFAPLFERYRINCAVTEPYSRVSRSLRRAGWKVRYSDARWTVLERP